MSDYTFHRILQRTCSNGPMMYGADPDAYNQAVANIHATNGSAYPIY